MRDAGRPILTSRNLRQNIGLYGGAIGATYYARFNRKPPWSFPKTALYATLGSVAGLALSSVVVAGSLYRSFGSFKDNDRFKVAVEHLRESRAREMGVTLPPRPGSGPGSGRGETDGSFSWPQQGSSSNADGSKHFLSQNSSVDFVTTSNSSANFTGTYDQPDQNQQLREDQSQSRWADIRAANNSAKSSTWDRIRESQQKAEIEARRGGASSSNTGSAPVSSQSASNSTSYPSQPPTRRPQPPNSQGDNGVEVLDKEKFEALLNAERNFGLEQDRKNGAGNQSRWS